jgi:hypothetical protein
MPRGSALLLGGQANGAVLRGNKEEGLTLAGVVERWSPSSDGNVSAPSAISAGKNVLVGK